MSTLGRPRDGVGDLGVEVLDDGEIALLGVDCVKVDVVLDDDTGDILTKVRVVARYDSESCSCGFPREGGNVILVLNDLDGDIFLTHSEQFQVAECSFLGPGFSSVSIDLDTKVVSLVLPVEFTLVIGQSWRSSCMRVVRVGAYVGNVEQVL